MRLAAELDAWLMGGEKGARPASRAAALYEEIEGLEAEYRALGIGHERVLAERAAHVEKNRRKMLGDMREHVETAAAEYRALVDQIEAKRQELLELRATEVWTAIYPSPTLTNEPSTAALVGAKKRLQEPHLPGLQSGVVAASIFNLLRADAGFCESVATVEQAALEQGVSVSRCAARTPAGWATGNRIWSAQSSMPPGARAAEEKGRPNGSPHITEHQRRVVWGEE